MQQYNKLSRGHPSFFYILACFEDLIEDERPVQSYVTPGISTSFVAAALCLPKIAGSHAFVQNKLHDRIHEFQLTLYK